MKTILLLSTALLVGTAFSNINQAKTSGWVAPSSADTVKNPLKGKADAVAAGKKLYTTYCVPCHGNTGKGDGIAAASINPRPADHTSAKVQNQSDGAIYWKLTTGKVPMASYAKILTSTQRWQLVDYIRTLKKA